MTPLERLAEAYWNAFRDGYARAGGDIREYPEWAVSHDPIKSETMRCLRHAVETLKGTPERYFLRTVEGMQAHEVGAVLNAALDSLFPEPLAKRSTKRTETDALMVEKLR